MIRTMEKYFYFVKKSRNEVTSKEEIRKRWKKNKKEGKDMYNDIGAADD